ncbi:MAG: DNA repair protein RecO [Patescibacteria group bacterium]
MKRSFSTPAIILKRSNVGETDRVLTLLTRKRGKLVCIAKGVRKMGSSKRAYLEPGNYVDAFLIKTKSMPLLTQAKLINQFSDGNSNLKKIRQLTQVLEIVDRLFVEGEEELELFEQVREILNLLSSPSPETGGTSRYTKIGEIKSKLQNIISQLGYHSSNGLSLLDHVAELSDKPMRSWEYLRV